MGSEAHDEGMLINRFGALIASALDLREVFPHAADLLKERIRFDAMGILLLSPEGDSFTIFAGTMAPDVVELSIGARLPAEGTASGLAVRSGQTVIVEDTRLGRFPYDAIMAGRGWRSYVVEPLRRTTQTLGTLAVLRREPGPIDGLSPDLLGSLAHTLAIAVENTRLYTEVSASEARYSSLVEGANDIIYRLDPALRFVFVNKKGEDLLERPRQEIEGLSFAEIVHAADRGFDLSRLLAKAATASLELRLVGARGRTTLTSHNLSLIRDGDKVVAIQGIARDVTREREDERAIRRYHALVEALDDYVFMADRAGHLLAANRKARQDLGWEEDDVKRHTIFDIHGPGKRGEVAAARDRLIETGSVTIELPVVTKSGREIPTRGHVTYQREIETLQGVFRDISEEKLLNARLVQTEKLRALGEMASEVAHTFNNLLAIIGTTIQVIKRAAPAPGIAGDLKAIEQAVYDGGAAVRRIQDVTRQRPEALYAPVDVSALAAEVARLALNRHRMGSEAAARPVSVNLELGEVPHVLGNDSELREVLMNVMFNAIDAMPEGGVVTVRSFSSEGRVVVAVKDTGRGMPADVRNKIFTPFFSTKGERGLGLGLSIALNIVSQHDGSIDVDSRPGEGTEVRLILPAVLEECSTP